MDEEIDEVATQVLNLDKNGDDNNIINTDTVTKDNGKEVEDENHSSSSNESTADKIQEEDKTTLEDTEKTKTSEDKDNDKAAPNVSPEESMDVEEIQTQGVELESSNNDNNENFEEEEEQEEEEEEEIANFEPESLKKNSEHDEEDEEEEEENNVNALELDDCLNEESKTSDETPKADEVIDQDPEDSLPNQPTKDKDEDKNLEKDIDQEEGKGEDLQLEDDNQMNQTEASDIDKPAEPESSLSSPAIVDDEEEEEQVVDKMNDSNPEANENEETSTTATEKSTTEKIIAGDEVEQVENEGKEGEEQEQGIIQIRSDVTEKDAEVSGDTKDGENVAEDDDDDEIQEITNDAKQTKASNVEEVVTLDDDDEQEETDICKISSTVSVVGNAEAEVSEEATTEAAASSLQTDEKLDSDDEESDMPTIRVKQFGLFAEESEEEDEPMDQLMDPNDLQNIMHVDMDVDKNKNQDESLASSRPKRRAAAAAANVIREISNQEENDKESSKRRLKDQSYDDTNATGVAQSMERNRCHICRKIAVCKITVQQYGQDIFLCSTSCFNAFRNPDPTRRPLPCAKCGILQNVISAYYWETMNFCSELCIGNYQMEIGAKCATCSKKVAWQSLGKYCVRFGSDVRQFCTASCLESYKKNARVCFHCQLDIKKLSNVILANIPSKQTPKEFCSQDCVEMYIEQNLHQTVRTKPNQNSNCAVCTQLKQTFRELVLPNSNFKVCSEPCWTKLLEVKHLKNPTKCEICTKYVNLDLGMLKPAFYVSSEKRVFGFCSATCKNVFVLRNREILACTTCKVKKYNYDLIRHVNESDSPHFAVCSLNCIPKPSQYITNLRDTLTPAATASEMFNLSKTRLLQEKQLMQATGTTPSRIRTTIMSDPNAEKSATPMEWNTDAQGSGGALRISSVSSLAHPNDIIEVYEGNAGDCFPTDITDEEMEELIASSEHFLVFPPKGFTEKKNKGCLVRPFMATVASQTNADSLNDLSSLNNTTSETGSSEESTSTTDKIITSSIGKKSDSGVVKEKYIPIFIPVFVPFPFYGFDSPVPVPLPVPIPVPIPVPVILPTDNSKSSSSSVAPSSSSVTTAISSVVPCNIPINNDHRQQQQQQIPQQHHQQHLHQGLQQMQQPMRNPVDKDNSGNSSAEIPENMRLDTVNFLDLTGPNVGEADSFDILNTIPSLDMDLDFDGTTGPSHHSMHHPGHPMMNQPMSLMQSVVDGNLQWQQQQQQQQQSLVMAQTMGLQQPPISVLQTPKYSREEYAIKLWKQYFGNESDPWTMNVKNFGLKLAEWVEKGSTPNGERFKPGVLLYLCLGIQEYLRRGNRPDKIFYDPPYAPFIHAFTNYAESSFSQGIVEGSIEAQNFWESAELGVNGPEVLLFTLIYFMYKYFNLRTWQEHSDLMFNQIVITQKIAPSGLKTKYMTIHGLGPKSEIPELDQSSQHCPIRIFEFYRYKCVNDQGHFYKSILPNIGSKGKWFATNPLGQMDIYQMLIRAMMIKG